MKVLNIEGITDDRAGIGKRNSPGSLSLAWTNLTPFRGREYHLFPERIIASVHEGRVERVP